MAGVSGSRRKAVGRRQWQWQWQLAVGRRLLAGGGWQEAVSGGITLSLSKGELVEG